MQIAEGRELPDPPLLGLENEAGHAYLSMLNTLYLGGTENMKAGTDVEARLMSLCEATLDRFEVTTPSGSHPVFSSIALPGSLLSRALVWDRRSRERDGCC